MLFPNFHAVWTYVAYYSSLIVRLENMVRTSSDESVGLASNRGDVLTIPTTRHHQFRQIFLRHGRDVESMLPQNWGFKPNNYWHFPKM